MPRPASTIARRPDVTARPRRPRCRIRAGRRGRRRRCTRPRARCLAGHRRDDNGDVIAGVELAFDMFRHGLDALDVATEVPPNFITRRDGNCRTCGHVLRFGRGDSRTKRRPGSRRVGAPFKRKAGRQVRLSRR